MKQVSDLKNAILYAQAMYDGAQKIGQLDKLYEEAGVLHGVVCEKENGFNKLNTPLLKYSQKEEVIVAICEKFNFSSSMQNSLKLMAENGCLNILPLVLQQFMLIYQEKHNIADIEITTVIPLSNQQEDLLKNKLENIFHKKISLHYVINPQIIGGLVIKYGTNFIDNSIKHKLDALEQLMKGTK